MGQGAASSAMDENAVSTVGDVVETVVDEVVPQSVMERIDEFSQTKLGGIAVTVMSIAITVLICAIAVKLTNRFFRRTLQKMLEIGNPAATAFAYLRYLALGAIYFTGFAVIVSNIPPLAVGMNKLFAAGGVLAVVIGLASQEAMGAIISGVIILVFKPFGIGDVVNVVSSGVSGTVEEITLRHTIIRTIENKRIIIPNDTMNSAIIENANHTENKVCLMLDVGITYESDIEHAMQIMREEITSHPDYFDYRTAQEQKDGAPPVVIRVQELADSAVVIRAQLWARDNSTSFAMRSDLLKSIKERCEAEGVDIAYPHLVVVPK